MTGPAAAQPSWHELEVGARIRFLANLATAPLGDMDVDEAVGVTTVITGVFDNTLNGSSTRGWTHRTPTPSSR